MRLYSIVSNIYGIDSSMLLRLSAEHSPSVKCQHVGSECSSQLAQNNPEEMRKIVKTWCYFKQVFRFITNISRFILHIIVLDIYFRCWSLIHLLIFQAGLSRDGAFFPPRDSESPGPGPGSWEVPGPGPAARKHSLLWQKQWETQWIFRIFPQQEDQKTSDTVHAASDPVPGLARWPFPRNDENCFGQKSSLGLQCFSSRSLLWGSQSFKSMSTYFSFHRYININNIQI